MTDDILFGPIKAIVAEELPECYTAEIELCFGNLCKEQEDSFKVVINLSWNEKAADFDRMKDEWSIEWTGRISNRIHQKYSEGGLLVSFRLPACQTKA